jgi:predicted KAP-like P-loop ATPase
MWADVETNQDFLNFRMMAGLAAKMILDSQGKPLSIGISGGWGVGKSSMVKLIEDELRATKAEKLLFLNFNAWLYQGHDDAKAALMEEISRALIKRAESDRTILQKAKEFFARINLFRLARIGGEMTATAVTGVPVGAFTKGLESLYTHLNDGEITADDVKEAQSFVREHGKDATELLGPKAKPQTPPQMIHALRKYLEDLLEELDVTLVVFVDDLDRCLPPTVIGTLEAMRLFLFMDRTAFVIAADDDMIKEAVRIHFKGASLDDNLVVSYFDKLIQVPLRVPPLGVNEARAYLMLLFVQNSTLEPKVKESVRAAVNQRLAESWKGHAVSAEFVAGLIADCPANLRVELAVAERLSKQMAASRRIGGNPRLMKRFLNTLSVRKKLADVQNIPVDDGVLAKILLFERCASPASFKLLIEAVNTGIEGRPARIGAAERAVRGGDELPAEGFDAWQSDKAFVSDWLKLDPPLENVDLRGALHVGRESLPILSIDDRVSLEARSITEELLALRLEGAEDLKGRFGRLQAEDRAFVMEKLLGKARSEPDWGTGDGLHGLSLVAGADTELAKQLVDFLADLSPPSLKPPLIPRVRSRPWGAELIEHWNERPDILPEFRRMLNTKKGR